MQGFSIRLEDGIAKKVRELALKDRRSVNSYIQIAVEKQVREDILKGKQRDRDVREANAHA